MLLTFIDVHVCVWILGAEQNNDEIMCVNTQDYVYMLV